MIRRRIESSPSWGLVALALLLLLALGRTAHADRPHGIAYEGALGAPLGMALGGLGTSTLEIGRDGAFQNLRLQNDWSESIPPTPAGTFLSVHARSKGGKGTGRLLQLAVPAGLEPVRGLTYTGRFPAAQIAYRDPDLPCTVTLEAFSPFVPHDAAASSLPLVFFTFHIRNPGPDPVTAAVAISWVNDIAAETQRGGWPACGNRNSVIAGSPPAVLMEIVNRRVLAASAVPRADGRDPLLVAAALLVAGRWNVRAPRVDRLPANPPHAVGHLYGPGDGGVVPRVACQVAADDRRRSTGQRRDSVHAWRLERPAARVPALQLGRRERLSHRDRLGNPLGR